MDMVIKADEIGKKYILSHQQKEQYRSLREVMTDTVKRWAGSMLHPLTSRQAPDPSHEEFWALKDVSFEIKQGDRVGIIGRNGAGKSTLLKILSRITEPTKGRINIRGRVASLLEVGTGFHPELTGRENIFLNGAILGMTKAEIGRKFDEIVDFAEVEKFLDTPVKRYSSGMYVRLAFAVAAHLEPEILVIDEVLAVGDAQFQKKCLGKMEDVSSKEGRTVLFVSHNMAAIQHLCNRALLLCKGQIIADGKTAAVIEKYLADLAESAKVNLSVRKDRIGTGKILFTSVTFTSEAGDEIISLASGATAKMILTFKKTDRAIRNFRVDIGINNYFGERIAWLSSEATAGTFELLPEDSSIIELTIPKLQLTPGRYGFTLFATVNGEIADWIKDVGFFTVEATDYYKTGKMPPENQGYFLFDYIFNIK